LFEQGNPSKIIGTKMNFFSASEYAEVTVELDNFKASDFKFKNAIINSGYKYYFKLTKPTKLLLIEAKLSINLNKAFSIEER